ncbi:hypothetical protein AGOR_G00128310 [Albula goreensis]|uniref:Uncharacterized protein n=1 Tax=Albula goreensis TaxID=1534307 RepID=A0A8T3DCI5_9TELE|nr:hypothetical protein AGOR_G00128310 [Albula goreensis]
MFEYDLQNANKHKTATVPWLILTSGNRRPVSPPPKRSSCAVTGWREQTESALQQLRAASTTGLCVAAHCG